MSKQQIGMIGVGVMGQKLGPQYRNHGFRVAVYDTWTDRMDEFINCCRVKHHRRQEH